MEAQENLGPHTWCLGWIWSRIPITFLFADGSFRNIVLIDTHHHLQNPSLFVDETWRVLSSGGKLVVVKPAITPISYPVYNYMHPEPVIMSDNLLPDQAVPMVS